MYPKAHPVKPVQSISERMDDDWTFVNFAIQHYGEALFEIVSGYSDREIARMWRIIREADKIIRADRFPKF